MKMSFIRPGSTNVHIWTIDVSLHAGSVAQLEGSLSWAERTRALALRQDADRTRFVVTRSALRQILGKYLGTNGYGLQFLCSPAGKPGLQNNPELEFNVSHSGRHALIAVSGSAVGIDVEEIHPNRDYLAIASRFYSAAELGSMLSLSEEKRIKLFFQYWTRKEATLKAAGTGLAGFRNAPLAGWSHRDIDLAENYAAAVAHRSEQAQLTFAPWEPT
jgi:4'-phosphopantetheinyl transferase